MRRLGSGPSREGRRRRRVLRDVGYFFGLLALLAWIAYSLGRGGL